MTVEGEFLDLGAHKQPGGKTVVAWACEGDFDPALLKSNTFSLEWPPRSGEWRSSRRSTEPRGIRSTRRS